MNGPDPSDSHPLKGFPQVCFIRNTVTNPNLIVGEYTYYDDPEDSEGFERNVLYHFPFIGDKQIIGKFCAIARGVRFIINGAIVACGRDAGRSGLYDRRRQPRGADPQALQR